MMGLGEWVLGDRIGEGGFGCVYKGYPLKLENGAPGIMAVKVAETSHPFKVDALLDEAELLSLFHRCPFVIDSYGQQWTSSSLNLFLEFAAGGTIRDRIDNSALSEREIKEFTKSVRKGLQCIHDKGYVHCDIKPDNILLVHHMDSPVDFVAKIGDFGLTKSAQNLHSRQGTKWYLPPETVLCNIQGKPSDIWAVGCLVLEMLTGSLWTCKSTEYLGVWASNPVIPSHLSDDTKDFLAKCLDVDASKRFTARRLLAHSFLMSNQSVEQLPKSPALSQSQCCHNRLPSFIPLGGSSSHEAQMPIESSGLDDDTIYPLALMSRPNGQCIRWTFTAWEIWRVCLFPKGNRVKKFLSMYLDVADSSTLPSGWINELDRILSKTKALVATFCQTSLPAALVLFISVVFQGCWFINMGFMLWVPKLVPKGCVVSFIEGSTDNMLGSSVICRSSESEFRARALANLQFSWILPGILIFTACTCLKFAGKCIQRDLSIEYEQLHSSRGADVPIVINDFKGAHP
ncbi:hypothetical protein ACLB2K_077337 [Fragaria x ananassa]